MQPIVKVGQRFKFTVLTDDALAERQGVVIRVLSNREEGLGLDVDQANDLNDLVEMIRNERKLRCGRISSPSFGFSISPRSESPF